eukprot:189778-Amphidinium_carterae.1
MTIVIIIFIIIFIIIIIIVIIIVIIIIIINNIILIVIIMTGLSVTAHPCPSRGCSSTVTQPPTQEVLPVVWSDPQSWPAGRVPGHMDDVQIAPGVHMILD